MSVPSVLVTLLSLSSYLRLSTKWWLGWCSHSSSCHCDKKQLEQRFILALSLRGCGPSWWGQLLVMWSQGDGPEVETELYRPGVEWGRVGWCSDLCRVELSSFGQLGRKCPFLWVTPHLCAIRKPNKLISSSECILVELCFSLPLGP